MENTNQNMKRNWEVIPKSDSTKQIKIIMKRKMTPKKNMITNRKIVCSIYTKGTLTLTTQWNHLNIINNKW